MIRLSRVGGSPPGRAFVLNCDLIQSIEATPDTVITLRGGEKLMVRESVEEVVRLTTEYRKRLLHESPGAPVGGPWI